MRLKTSWTFKGRSLESFTKTGGKRVRQTKFKKGTQRNCWLGFLLRERIVRWGTTTLMTSSNGDIVPSGPIKETKTWTESNRLKEWRKRKEKRGMGVGLNWLTSRGRCVVLPWVGGRGSGAMVQPTSSPWVCLRSQNEPPWSINFSILSLSAPAEERGPEAKELWRGRAPPNPAATDLKLIFFYQWNRKSKHLWQKNPVHCASNSKPNLLIVN